MPISTKRVKSQLSMGYITVTGCAYWNLGPLNKLISLVTYVENWERVAISQKSLSSRLVWE
jgi:hypothetical protein